MNKKNKGFTSIPTDPFDVSYDAKRNMGKWQRFFSYYKPYKGLFFADMFFAIMGAAGVLVVPPIKKNKKTRRTARTPCRDGGRPSGYTNRSRYS